MVKIKDISLQNIDDEAEFIPLLTQEDEEEIQNEKFPNLIPILPLKNTILFPGVVIPITASKQKSVRLIKDVNENKSLFGLVLEKKQKETSGDILKEIHHVGTLAKILRIIKMPDGNITVILQGKKKFEIESIVEQELYLKATVKESVEIVPPKDDNEFESLIDSIKEVALQLIKLNPNIPSEASIAIKNIESQKYLINYVSSNLNISSVEKQQLLEINDLKVRAFKTLGYLDIELKKLQLKNNIHSKVRQDLDQQQKEYFLHQQLKTIQEELGEYSTGEDFSEMRQKADKKKWNDKVKAHFNKELNKFQRMNPQIAEYGLQRNYLELFLDLPWEHYSKDKLDIKRAERILNADHYGLQKVKRRILEFLAVLKIRKDMKSPILCFYGPPGVGKTSLGKSIAKALGREYVRVSLGGMTDEAEIRGHRKTYIGAMPGRIIQSIKKSGTSNPVFVLDEIDKMHSSYNGDPSSAMLEVLDPEQNHEFYDNFLEVGYDLTKVMFVATSNSLNTIHPALMDRMEIIEVNGYTIEEKIQIAKKHLIPKLLKDHGLEKKHLKIGITLISKVIENFTRESGVRGLEKQLAKIVRYTAKSLALEESYDVNLTQERLSEIMGPPKIQKDTYESNNIAGVVTGLAWTSTGGDILFIESTISEGRGKLNMTGNIGKVMNESATIALEYIKSNAKSLGFSIDLFKKYDVHIHVPEGATPKDGPSAGITLLTSLVSLFTQKKIKKNLAMTGEITLRGKVLPVGGIKEKILAAKRAKIKDIILSVENKKDVEDIGETYLKGLTFHYVSDMMEVIEKALTNTKVKNAKVL